MTHDEKWGEDWFPDEANRLLGEIVITLLESCRKLGIKNFNHVK